MRKNILLHHNTFADLSVNDEITENGIYVYLCLKAFANPNWTYLRTTIAEINSVLSDADITYHAKLQAQIRKGLEELEQANYIKIISNKKNSYELDLDGMVEEYSKDNPYTTFEAETLKLALKDNKGYKSIFKYLSDYFYFLTHNDNGIDGQEKEMYYFQKERTAFADECELNVRSFDKYNDILMKNEIIYIHKYDYKYSDSNKQVPNAYGLYKNKDEIDERCNEYISGLKDGVYQSSIPRGKGSKKQKEEKKAQYTPVEADEFVVTDEELAEHDKRHKELYAKKMSKKNKPVATESVSMQEVEETVQADDNEQEVQADSKKEHKMTMEEIDRKWHNKPVQKVEKKKVEKVTEPVETHRVDRDEEYNVLMSELKFNSNTTFDKASKMFDDLLLEKYGFINETDDDKALKERFKNEWETAITVQKVELIKEDEEANPFA